MAERDYQLLHIDKTIEAVTEYRKVLAQLPTGGGKTVEFSLISQRYIRITGKSVLILVHRKELMQQAFKTIEHFTGIKPKLITSKTRKYQVARIYIAMVDSAASRLHMTTNVGLVIIDECHIANFNKMHSIFLEELIIGFSATPLSSSKKEPLNKYYRKLIVGPQIRELISLGFLAQNITRCPKNVIDANQFEIDRLKGDYNEAKMADVYKQPKHIIHVIEYYHKIALHEKCIVFNVNIEHSKEMTEAFITCGYNARHLDSNSEKKPSIREGFDNERDEIINWFKITPNAILNNCMITTVGFDEPTTQHIFLNFSTLSLVKYIQCAGRGGRIINLEFIEKYQKDYPYQLEIKEHFNIIDMGGNWMKHGDWSDDRDWNYIFENPEKPGDGTAPIKICPSCDALVHAAARVCTAINENDEICGYEFEKKKTKEEEEAGELVIITKGINIENLIEKNNQKYDYYLFYKMAEDVVSKMYEKYSEPSEALIAKAFESYYELCIDWWKKKMAGVNGNISDISTCPVHIRKARIYFNNLIKKKQLTIDI